MPVTSVKSRLAKGRNVPRKSQIVKPAVGDVFVSTESGNRQARIVKAIETLRPKGELGLIRNPRHIGILEAGGTNVTL